MILFPETVLQKTLQIHVYYFNKGFFKINSNITKSQYEQFNTYIPSNILQSSFQHLYYIAYNN